MFEVRLSRSAARYYRSCDRDTARRLNECFCIPETNPFPPHPRITQLRGRLAGNHRYRVGRLRVVYTVFADKGTVYIRAIGPRGDAYYP